MNKCFYTCLLLLVSIKLHAIPSTNDSTEKSFIRNFNLSIGWFEYGYFIPVHEKKLQQLPYGMNHYFYNTKGSSGYSFLSLGIYYKDRFGLEALYRHVDFNVEGDDYKNYIAAQHPGYYVPAYMPTYFYSFDKIEYRFCYRKHFKHFMLEPKFQLGINDYNSYDSQFTIKEKGSNQFIAYKISSENLKKNNFSYHFILNISKRFNPFQSRMKIETALKFEYMMAPVKYNYTIEEKPYGKNAIINQVVISHLHPAFGIEACIYFFLKK